MSISTTGSSDATQMREGTRTWTASSAVWSDFCAFRPLDRRGTGQIQVDSHEWLQLTMYS
eukprot:bmy_19747T0